MFIPMWLIILIVVLMLASLFISIFAVFSIRLSINTLKKIDDNTAKISQSFRIHTKKVGLEPEIVESSKFDKFLTSFIGDIRDINACIAFFVWVVSATLFFLLKTDLKFINDYDYEYGILIFFVVIGIMPNVSFCIKLIKRVEKYKGWRKLCYFIFAIFALFVFYALLSFSTYTLIDNVMKVLEARAPQVINSPPT